MTYVWGPSLHPAPSSLMFLGRSAIDGLILSHHPPLPSLHLAQPLAPQDQGQEAVIKDAMLGYRYTS